MSAKQPKDATPLSVLYGPWRGNKGPWLYSWLNCYKFVLLYYCPLFLYFLTSLIKFTLCNSGKGQEGQSFSANKRQGTRRWVCLLQEGPSVSWDFTPSRLTFTTSHIVSLHNRNGEKPLQAITETQGLNISLLLPKKASCIFIKISSDGPYGELYGIFMVKGNTFPTVFGKNFPWLLLMASWSWESFREWTGSNVV